MVPPIPHNAKVTLLVVDQHEGLCELYKALSEDTNQTFLFASSDADALKLIEKQSISLILSTTNCANINGVELANQLFKTQPQLPIVFLTLSLKRAESFLLIKELPNVKGLFLKPRTAEELKAIITTGFN